MMKDIKGYLSMVSFVVICAVANDAIALDVNISPTPVGGVVTSSPYTEINCGTGSANVCFQTIFFDPFIPSVEITFIATPNTGYVFRSWSNGVPGSPYPYRYPNTYPVTISAYFDPLLTIDPVPTLGTITSTPAGINCGPAGSGACSTPFPADTPITLTVTPSTGYGVNTIVISDQAYGGGDRLQPTKSQTFTKSSLPETASATFYDATMLCGTANGQTFSTAPVTGLCNYGPAPSQVNGTGPWTWTCTGWSGISTPVQCSANKLVTATPGSCGSAAGTPVSTAPTANLCGPNSTPTAVEGTGPWTWTCNSTNGGAPSPVCTAPLLVTATPGSCGSAAGIPVSIAPTANLCGPNSTPTAVQGYGPWTWTCNSTNGGAPSPVCTAPLATPQIYVQLPRTGQTKCYDAAGALPSCTGTSYQDGELQKGAPWPVLRFTDNFKPDGSTPDGTFTDNLTGLVWLKNYQCSNSTWAAALSTANALADGTCGLADGSTPGTWRLPNINELRSMFDIQKAGPALQTGHPYSLTYYAARLWSSTSSFADFKKAMAIGLQSAEESSVIKSNSAYAWFVKGSSFNTLKTGQTLCYDNTGTTVNALSSCTGTGQDGEYATDAARQVDVAWDSSRFVNNNAEGTVTDTVTGLVWLKDMACAGTKVFADAITWSNNLSSGTCGLNDGSSAGNWRLPNRTELMSLLNHGRSSSADHVSWLSGIGFTNYPVTANDQFGTSSTYVNTSNSAWQATLDDGVNASRSKTLAQYVLPVRDGNFLSVNIVGGGSGNVNSTNAGLSPAITCPGGTCRSQYSRGTVVTLAPTSSWYSIFSGWNGCDSVGGNVCSVTINESRVASAEFIEKSNVGAYDTNDKNTAGNSSRIQVAYDAFAANNPMITNGSIITTVDNFYEQLNFASPITLNLSGGWDGTSWPTPLFNGFTTVVGSLRISNGKLLAKNLKIRQ